MNSAIAGIGLDVVEIGRVARLLSGPAGERFMDRVLTDRERAAARDMAEKRLVQYVAGRFALKEAVAKALGCGIGGLVGFRDIEAVPDELGKPCCSLSEDALGRLGFTGRPPRLHVAITHERSLAAATALLEREL